MKELVGHTVVELFPLPLHAGMHECAPVFENLCKISQTVQDSISIRDKIMCRISYFCLIINLCQMSIERLKIDKTSHISKNFLLIICAKGKLTAKINSTVYPMEESSLLVVPPMHIYSVSEFTTDNVNEIFPIPDNFVQKLPFTPDFNFLKRVSMNPYTRLSGQASEDMLQLISIIRRYDSEDIHRSEYIIESITTSVILIASSSFSISDDPSGSGHTRAHELAKSFFDLLMKNFRSGKSVGFYAEKIFVSPKYLSMSVKAATGRSAQCWINESILFESKRLLLTTSMTVREIADMLNFPDSSSFVRFFRMHAGCTPLVFRKQH